MNSKQKAYREGFKDCMEHFEESINNAIDRISEEYSMKTLTQAFDTVIASLYIARYALDDMEGECVEEIINKMFDVEDEEPLDMDKVFEDLFKTLKGEDVNE